MLLRLWSTLLNHVSSKIWFCVFPRIYCFWSKTRKLSFSEAPEIVWLGKPFAAGFADQFMLLRFAEIEFLFCHVEYRFFVMLQWIYFVEGSTPQQRACLHWGWKGCTLLAWPFAPSTPDSGTSGYLDSSDIPHSCNSKCVNFCLPSLMSPCNLDY